MRKLILSFTLSWLFCSIGQISSLTAQESEFNLGLDRVSKDAVLPEGWKKIGFHKVTIQANSENDKDKFVTIESRSASPFGVIQYHFPIENAGKRITMSANVKVNQLSDSGKAAIGIAFFKGSQRIALFANTEIEKNDNWKQYSVSAIPPPDADRFAITGAVMGGGVASFNNFQVATFRGASKELNGNWEGLFPAVADDEFDAGSKIETLPTDAETVAALDLLGRVWGFVKYHHPTIADGKKNWDYELLRFLPGFLAAKPESREELLLKWVNDLGEFDVVDSNPMASADVKLEPDLKWFESIQSTELVKKLNQIQKANRGESHYYVAFKRVGNPIFLEESYEQFRYPDAGFRLLALYRHWNMVQYYFPYRELTDKNWNQVLTEMIPRFANAKDALEYQRAAMELISCVQDTHAQLYGPDEIVSKFHGIRQVPIKVRFIENELVVTDLLSLDDSEKVKLEVGDVVTSIDGMSVADWIADRGRYHWASNKPTKLRNIANAILRTNNQQLSLGIKNGKATKSVTLETIKRGSYGKLVSEKNNARKPWETLEGKIAYLYPGSLQPDDVKTRTVRGNLRDKDALVIDLRGYPSQFIVFTIGNRLMPEATQFVKLSKAIAKTPGAFAMMDYLPLGRKNRNAFRGKIAILIDERTQSQAEYTAMAMRVAPPSKGVWKYDGRCRWQRIQNLLTRGPANGDFRDWRLHTSR